MARPPDRSDPDEREALRQARGWLGGVLGLRVLADDGRFVLMHGDLELQAFDTLEQLLAHRDELQRQRDALQ